MTRHHHISLALPPLGRATAIIGAALIATVILQLILDVGFGVDLIPIFGLKTSSFYRGAAWQPLTSILLHSTQGFGHLIFNLVALYIFGGQIEARIGGRSLTKLFIAGALLGAVTVLGVDSLRLLFGLRTSVVVGASGGIAALVAAYSVLNWDRWINLFVIRLTGRNFLILFVAIDVIRVMMGAPISLASHLGGVAAGLMMSSPRWHPRVIYRRVVAKRRAQKPYLRVYDGGADSAERDDTLN